MESRKEHNKEHNSDKLLALAKEQIDTLREIIANLETSFKAVQQELSSLQQQKFSADALYLKEQKYFVLPNLAKKNEEAIYDAINFFDKKCPYCDTNLYEGHPRKKIEIDHYIPMSKGGQDVPWNILPTCKKCNGAKRNKSPEVFLETARRQYCENYLDTVRKRLVDEMQIQIDQYQQIKNYLSTCSTKIRTFQRTDLNDVLIKIARLLDIELKNELKNVDPKANLSAFIEACCYPLAEAALNTRTKFKDIYEAFSEWFIVNYEENPPTKKGFSSLLKKYFRCQNVGGQIWFYGVALRPKVGRSIPVK